MSGIPQEAAGHASDDRPSEPTSTSETPTTKTGEAPAKRMGAKSKLLVVVIATVGVLYGALWWQDRPLRSVESRLERGQPEMALEEISVYLKTHPDEKRALALKARALVDANRTLEGVEIFEKIGLAEPAEMFSLAKAYVKLEQWTRAMPLLARVTSAEPNNGAALQELIRCQYHLGAYSQGLTNSEKLTKTPNFAAQGYAWQALYYQSVDDRPRGIEAFAQALEAAPDGKGLPLPGHDFARQFAEMLVADGQIDEARRRIDQSLQMEPSAEALALLARIQEKAGDAEAAAKTYAKALDLDPANVDACEALAQRAFDAGDYETAQRRLMPLAANAMPRLKTARILTAISEQSGDEAESKRWRGRLKQLESFQKTDESVERLMKKAPESLWAGVVRAHRFAMQGNWTQAQAVLEPLREQAPSEPLVQDLWEAIAQRGPLPSLERLPVE